MASALRTEVLQQVKDHVEGVTGALGARVQTLEGQVNVPGANVQD